MDIRETIRNKSTIAALAVVAIIVATAAIVWELSGPRVPHRPMVPLAFFSDDDGKTWFVDKSNNIPPFVHNGKQAVRAVVYRASSGLLFVGWLQKYPDEQKRQIDAAIAARPELGVIWLQTPMQFKKPGELKWTSSAGPAGLAANSYQSMATIAAPDGSGDAVMVHPADSNNGASHE